MERLWLTSEEYQQRHLGRVRRQLTPEESARIFMYQGMGSGSGAWNPGNPVMPGGTGGEMFQPMMALRGCGPVIPQPAPTSPGITCGADDPDDRCEEMGPIGALPRASGCGGAAAPGQAIAGCIGACQTNIKTGNMRTLRVRDLPVPAPRHCAPAFRDSPLLQCSGSK